MNHHAAVGEGSALAFLSCHEENGSHRSSHASAGGGNIALHELHRVVDTKSSVNTTTRRVDVDGDIFARVGRVKIEQLSLERIGGVVVNGCAEEDDAVHHQSAKYIHLRHIELTFFEDVRVEILVLCCHYIVKDEGVNAHVFGGKLAKILVHNLLRLGEKGREFFSALRYHFSLIGDKKGQRRSNDAQVSIVIPRCRDGVIRHCYQPLPTPQCL